MRSEMAYTFTVVIYLGFILRKGDISKNEEKSLTHTTISQSLLIPHLPPEI